MYSAERRLSFFFRRSLFYEMVKSLSRERNARNARNATRRVNYYNMFNTRGGKGERKMSVAVN